MGSWKIERELEPGGLPQFLRELADVLEPGAAEGAFSGLPVDDLRKLVLVAERRGNGTTLKLKAKRSGEVRVPTTGKPACEAVREDACKDMPGDKGLTAPIDRGKDRGKDKGKDKGRSQARREKYCLLKKALQADFKVMQARASEGLLPGGETLESFLSLAELMGQGEQPVSGAALAEMAPANATFLDDCQALRRAYAARDAVALGAALERLARRKSACHAQFR